MGYKIITNHQPRFTIDAYELSSKQRKEFDYLDWPAIEAGEDSATFVQYKGTLYDLGEFMVTDQFGPYWHGSQTDTFFSATLVHMCDDDESVIIGRAYS